jgi:ribosomal protein S20
MKLGARCAAWLLPFLVTGCLHKKPQVAQNQPLPPQIEDTAPPKQEPAPANLNPPVATISEQPQQQQQITPPAEPVKKPPKHNRKPANTNTQIASAGQPPAVPAVGNLTTSDPNTRQLTDASIEQTEKALNGISRKLNEQEQKTAAQIREFIKQARESLTSGDVDAAHTLATKAKVLLDELHP